MADRWRTIGYVLRWPLCIAIATLIGLVGALVGGPPWRLWAWFALTIPAATVGGYVLHAHAGRRRKRPAAGAPPAND